jgi:hypothetical protein
VSEQHDDPLVERVGGAEHRVHEGAAHPAAFVALPHAERAEPEGRQLAGQQRRPRDAYVPHHRTVDHGDERQPRQPRPTHAQGVDQPGLDRIATGVRRGERVCVDVGDDTRVTRKLTAHKHRAKIQHAG